MTEDAIHTERKGLPSASGAEKLYMCAGSWQAEKEAPDSEPRDYTVQGQEIAAALESDDFTELDEDGKNIATKLKELEDQAKDAWAAEMGFQASAKLSPVREERLWIHGEKGSIGSARLDVFWIHAGKALAIDDKSGYLKVTPSHRNYQLRMQALALWCEYSVKHIRVGTAQYRFRGQLEICDYKEPLLWKAMQEYEFAWWRAQQPYAPRQAGSWCRYCKAKPYCREAAAYSLLPVPVAKPGMDIAAAVAQLTPQELAFLHEKKAIAEKVFEAVDVRLRALPREVLNEVGLDLGTPGSSRSIDDIQKLWSLLYAQGVTQEEFIQVCKAAIGKVEALMIPKIRAKDAKVTSDAAAKKVVAKLIDPAVETKPKQAPLIAYKKEIKQ